MPMQTIAPLIWNTLLPALLSAAAPALTWALAKAGQYFKAKATAADASAAQSKIYNALDQLDMLASNVVAHLNVDMKEKLTSYLADGVLSEAEKADLKTSAMGVLTSDAGPQALALLKSTLGDAFQLIVSGAIERAVMRANAEKLASAARAGADAAAKVTTLEDAAAILGKVAL